MRSSQSDASGFVMVVLLIVMGIGAVWMAASLPAWKQQATREKEADLVFRGQQYVRALRLYQMKNGPNTRPPSIDVLVDGKFLRKKYKDPITNEDFIPLQASSQPTAPGQQPPPPGSGRSGAPAPPQPGSTGAQGGGIIGVASKSSATSIRVYNQATHYNEWVFMYSGQSAPGGRPGGPGGVNPGRGNPTGGPVGINPGRGGPGGTPPAPGRGPLPGPGRGRGNQ